MNWYIKYPEIKVRANYYIQPFHPYLWACILCTITFGCFWSVLIKKILKNDENVSLIDFAFLAFESFCNQFGFGKDFKKYSLRILNFTFKLTALIIVPAYGGDLTSYLAIKLPKIPFNNLEEFVKNGRYILLYHKGHFLKRHFAVRTFQFLIG